MSWNRRMEHDLDRDIEHHLTLETEDNIARGMSPEEARYAALRKFGNITRVKENTRSVWTRASLDTLYADLRHAFRRLRQSPGTAALAILSLALAFAPSVTVFSVIDRLFLTPLPFRAPDELVQIRFHDTRPNVDYLYPPPSYSEYRDLRRSLTSFSGLAYQREHGATLSLNGRRILVFAHTVSDGYFGMLGLPLHSGPGLSRTHPGVIISHSLWKREFDGRPDIVGRPLLVTGQSFTIDGIAAPDFYGAGNMVPPIDLWIPIEAWLQLQPAFRPPTEQRDARQGALWARLRPGVSRAQAEAEVERAGGELSRLWPATNRGLTALIWDEMANRRKGNRNVTAIGVFLLGIVLAVACANVAGILLARAEERRHETAVRQALGASRARLVREWMIESALLSTSAAALGLAVARVLIDRLPALIPGGLPITFEFSLGPRVWLYAASLVVFSTLSFGLVPAWRGSRPDLLSGLRRDAAVSVLTVRVPIRSLLIVFQVATAEALLFTAGLALNTLSFAHHLDAGFDPRHPVAIAMLVPMAEDGKLQPIDRDAMCDRLARIAGVRRAAYSHFVPLASTGAPKQKLEIPGQEPREIRGGSAGPGFLSVLGMRILSGRDLQRADQHAVLINTTLARQLDPAGNAVGRQIRLNGALVQIVGVFQDVAVSSVHEPPEPRALSLMPARAGGDTFFALEVTGDPGAYVAALRNELIAAQPGSLIVSAQTLWQYYQDSLFAERISTQAFYGLGLIALLLTITGLHGITAALFARRSKEFAIRLALGAEPRRIVGTVLASGLKLAAAGLILGLAVAVPLALLIASKLPGFSPWSAAALWLSSAIVLVAAIAAAAHPARRVLGIQPADIIRTE